jgi:predicted short-subunit dehydrogenase-like oxidoreductase (DUF2520 family)
LTYPLFWSQPISGLFSYKTIKGNDEVRVKLHVACVFACNFTNYMYLQSARFCEAENLDFSLLQSLIEETANRLQAHHPAAVFTGPAVRGDMATVNKHLLLLEQYPLQYELYKMISENIMKLKMESRKWKMESRKCEVKMRSRR